MEVMAVVEAVLRHRFNTSDFVMQPSYIGKEEN